jgi:hypothetical protein
VKTSFCGTDTQNGTLPHNGVVAHKIVRGKPWPFAAHGVNTQPHAQLVVIIPRSIISQSRFLVEFLSVKTITYFSIRVLTE